MREDTFQICSHLLAVGKGIEPQYFTGEKLQFYLICHSCHADIELMYNSLQTVTEECFTGYKLQGCWVGAIKKTLIPPTLAPIVFAQQIICLPDLLSTDLLDIQPVPKQSESRWIGVTKSGKVISINFTSRVITEISHELVGTKELNLNEPVSLHVSPYGSFIAVVNTLGTAGVVLDSNTGEVTMHLQREDYHCDVTPFPITFFLYHGKALLMHATDWNRLEISDPLHGDLLTLRALSTFQSGENRPDEHYVDYFHGRLLVSPDYQWVIDDGWVWLPAGEIIYLNIVRWLMEDLWEGENAAKKNVLARKEDSWGGPICWIDAHTVAIWGYGSGEQLLIPAVGIYDIISNSQLYWIAGVEVQPNKDTSRIERLAYYGGALYFDKYLFACSDKFGISVWDIHKGTCVYQDSVLTPRNYHPGAKEFLSLLPNGDFILATLIIIDSPKGEIVNE